MIDWVTENIAVSEYPSSKTDLGQFYAVFNLDRFNPYSTDRVHVHVPLIDGPGNEPQEIVSLLGVLDRHIQKGKVLVHCAAGASRSPFLIALYLAWKQGLTFDRAVEMVASKRRRAVNIDPGLLEISDQVLGLVARTG